ncbi:MAG: hypothetical protein Q8K58_00935 [Acidimicrobiales bacterium]|nr:hypothetical protein [Acidimicrobiales bacterium]
MLTTEPSGYDAEGHPLFGEDDLDRHYAKLLDKLSGWFDIDNAIGYILRPENAPHWDDLLWTLDDMLDRERQRNAKTLSPEDGERVWRDQALADLRLRSDRYAQVAPGAGWPSDPEGLDNPTLSEAVLVVCHPEVLEAFVAQLRSEREGSQD